MKLTVKKFFNNLGIIEYIFIFIAIFVVGFASFFSQHRSKYIFVEMVSTPQEYREDSFPPEYWQISEINKGDASYNSLGKKELEIVEVVTDQWGGKRQRIKIKLKLAVTFDTRMSIYLFNNKPLTIGQNFELVIGDSLFKGTVISLGEKLEDLVSRENKEAIIQVKVRGLELWHANAIAQMNVVNSKGEQVLTVEDYKITPADKVVVTDRGEVFKRWSPITKDLLITFHLYKVNCENSMCYFNDFVPIQIGGHFWAHSDKTFIDKSSIVDVSIL